MRAITYDIKPIGWATCFWLKRLWRSCLLTRLNGLRLDEIDTPELPGDDWVLVETLLGGVCGTDLSLLAQAQPPNSILQGFSSMPIGLGHENVAVVRDVGPDVDRSWIGRRVCVEPTLGCRARGIDPPCKSCRDGRFGTCEHFSGDVPGRYSLPAGTSIGYNSRTGGSYGQYFTAHESQLIGIPDELSDEQAVLTDPVACGLHAVLRTDLSDAKRVLVYGSGVMGLGIIASLRAVGFDGHIDALDRHEYLGRAATGFGADDFFRLGTSKSERYEAIAQRTGGTVQRVRFGNYMLSGGYDIVFDCVGSASAVSECLKWTRADGQAMFVGTGHGGAVDLTPVWFTELRIKGVYGRGVEQLDGKTASTYELVHDLMLAGKLNVGAMLTHKFPLDEYRQAFSTASGKAAHNAIKVAFDFRQ
ncbi:MAG: alcohol dehydrogenase catalytic domain-containing protein [Phycisphaerae bacterium]|jgi:threonine dehydrogenase-like Zn-dependent dehydrogenase|nr:alcohol dehydrogenase catalytic domain-containing protein [Phycisphaerae bacterium]